MNGHATARGQLRRARLGGAPQQRHLAAVGAGRRLRQRRSGLGQLADGRRLALAAPLGALRCSAATRRSCATRAYPVMKGAARVLPRLAGRRRARAARHVAVDVARAQVHAPRGGTRRGQSPASTMDMALVRDLFANPIEAAEVLGRRRGVPRRSSRQTLRAAAPYRIGSDGQLQEWREDFEEPEPEHRHFSHLFGLHPGRQITRDGTPALFAAARRSLELRGDGGTGWAWPGRSTSGRGCSTATTRSGCSRNLLQPASSTSDPNYRAAAASTRTCSTRTRRSRSTATSASTAGIAEMLVQSHAGEIHLLPALPSAWRRGAMQRPARARRVRDGPRLARRAGDRAATIRSTLGGVARIRTTVPITVTGAASRPAAGANPNPFFKVHDPGTPEIADRSKVPAPRQDTQQRDRRAHHRGQPLYVQNVASSFQLQLPASSRFKVWNSPSARHRALTFSRPPIPDRRSPMSDCPPALSDCGRKVTL